MEGNRCGHKKDAGEFVYRYANIAAYSVPSQNRSTPLLFISPNFKALHSISIYHQPLSLFFEKSKDSLSKHDTM